MTLTLLAISLNDRPLSQPITAHFDHNGGTIGRADHNTMALPDPERQISRLQAEIVANGSGFVIRNVSAANPIVVAGRSIEQGETAEIVHGDEVRIGGYLLHVDSSNQDNALDVTRGRARISAHQTPPPAPVGTRPPPRAATGPMPTASGGNPFADMLGSATGGARGAGDDPFGDILGAPSAPPRPAPAAAVPARPFAPGDTFSDLMAPPSGLPKGSAGLAAPAAPAVARLPEDFDIFAPSPAAAAGSAAAPAARADPFADLGAPTPSIDEMFGLGQAASDPLADFMAKPAPAAGKAGPAAVPVDPLEALFGSPPPAQAAAPAQYDHLPAINQPYAPPRVQPAAVPVPAAPRPAAPLPQARPPPGRIATAPVPSMPAAAPASADPVDSDAALRLWTALCEGAGIEVPLQPARAEEQMRETGRILRSALDGVLRLMAIRATARHELRAAVTVIKSRNNNPLKFSLEDPKSGLESLLQPTMRGFLQGRAAMDDAMQDLVGHAIGTMAGMRAAIEGLLDRYSPQALEQKLEARSLLDSVLPMNRKAKLWDLYQQHNLAIRAEAQEDFDALFGKAFLEAYEQQVDQLRHTPP